MDLTTLLISMFKDIPKDISIARILESTILLSLIWSKIKPHLTKIEQRMEGLEQAVKVGFNNGSIRFETIEYRLKKLEEIKTETIPKGDNYGTI